MPVFSTVNGLPAHILLNHFVIAPAPLTAILAVLCALWPAAWRRLIRLELLLAAGTVILVPPTFRFGCVVGDPGRCIADVARAQCARGSR